MPRHTHTFTVKILGPPIREEVPVSQVDEEHRKVSKILSGRVWNDVADVLNDQLPDGWFAEIDDWEES